MRKKILIFGHYGVPNWGDEAILSGILSQIDSARFTVTVVTNSPDFTMDHHGVDGVLPPPFGLSSFFKGGFLKFLKTLKSSDFIFFGGGGLFQENPPKALLIWEYYLWFCRKLKKKIFFIGQSFEGFEKEKTKKSLKEQFKKIKFFSLREESSVNFLIQELGIAKNKVFSSSDAAYFLESPKKKGKSREILLSIRSGEISINHLKNLIKQIRAVFPRKKIEFLCMQSNISNDDEIAKQLDIPVFYPQDLDDLQEKIHNVQCVITSRLHAGILANIQKTPFFAIAPRKKLSNFFGEKYFVTVEEFSTKKGQKKIGFFLKNPTQVLKEQQKFLLQNKKKLKNIIPSFFLG